MKQASAKLRPERQVVASKSVAAKVVPTRMRNRPTESGKIMPKVNSRADSESEDMFDQNPNKKTSTIRLPLPLLRSNIHRKPCTTTSSSLQPYQRW